MKANWAIIPDINRISETVALAEKYNAAFEYNDFFIPKVYEDTQEVNRRIKIYKSVPKFGAPDTLHGVFYDIAATAQDTVIRSRSRELMKMSMQIAQELECKGVVFHSGLIGGYETEKYILDWVDMMSEVLMNLSEDFSGMEIYVENTFEPKPTALLKLMEACRNFPQIKLCLDYAHAALTEVSLREWVAAFNSYLGHIHINDNDLVNDLHYPPGSGKIDYKEFANLLGNSTERGINTLVEVTGLEGQTSGLKHLENLQ